MALSDVFGNIIGKLGFKKKSLSGEIATRQIVSYSTFLGWLPNPDPVLKKMGKDITAYDEIRSDGYVRGCIKSRKAGVLGLLSGTDRGKAKSRNAKLIEDLFKNLDMNRIISEILDATQFGYAPLEIIWEQVGGYWLPKDIMGKPKEWFNFDDKNQLCLRTMANFMGEPVPPYKFLCPRQEASYNNPYGFADLSCCFWPATFKKGGLKSWLIFSEKWGQAFALGKQPRGASQGETQKLLDSLEQMVQDAIAVVPDDSSVELIEMSGKGASSLIYKDLIQTCKQEISVVQLGHEGGALSTPGKLGEEGQAIAVRDDIVAADKRIVEQTMKQLISWIWELNFTGERPMWSMWREEDVDERLAKRDDVLTQIGVRFNTKYIAENYDIPEDQFTVSEPGRPRQSEAMQFSEGLSEPQNAIDAAVENLSPEELQAQAEGILKPVIDLIEKSNDLNAVLEQLTKVYPQMKSAALREMIQRAIFVAELLGRATA